MYKEERREEREESAKAAKRSLLTSLRRRRCNGPNQQIRLESSSFALPSVHLPPSRGGHSLL
eukprot:1152919-Pelagomonas_calceolata.AAC.1